MPMMPSLTGSGGCACTEARLAATTALRESALSMLEIRLLTCARAPAIRSRPLKPGTRTILYGLSRNTKAACDSKSLSLYAARRFRAVGHDSSLVSPAAGRRFGGWTSRETYPTTRRDAPASTVSPEAGCDSLSSTTTPKVGCTKAAFPRRGCNRVMRQGNLKLVSRRPEQWELYDLEADRTELNNLAGKYPVKVKVLMACTRVGRSAAA